MKKGDIVKFKGFYNYPDENNQVFYGIVIRQRCTERIDVLWGNGFVGLNLWVQTIELVCESK